MWTYIFRQEVASLKLVIFPGMRNRYRLYAPSELAEKILNKYQFSGILEDKQQLEGENVMAEKIYGLLILPYQYLQMIGYRLSGIPCRYEFGAFGVEPLKPTTRSQHLVSKLLPLFILGIGWMIQIGIAVYLARLYQPTLPFVPLFFILLSTPPLALYTHYVRFDLTQKNSPVGQPHSSQQRQN